MDTEGLKGLYRTVDLAIEEILEPIQDKLYCKNKCYWCCGLFQDIQLHELELDLITESVKVPKIQGHWCPFLKDGSCSIYSIRPLSCRAYFSNSILKCQKNFRGNGSTEIHAPINGLLIRGKAGDILLERTQNGKVYKFFPALRAYYKTSNYGKPYKILGEYNMGDKDNGGDKGESEPLDVPHTIEEVIEQTIELEDHKSGDNGKKK